MNIIEHALAELDRTAGNDRSAQSVMRLTANVIAGSNSLTATQRMTLLSTLEMVWRDAGLTG